MSKMKYVLLLVLVVSLCFITSCKGKEKTFSDSGITITLNSKFKKQNIQGAQIVYATSRIGFMGNPESKELLMIPNDSLDQYTEKVISVNNLDIDYQIYDEDDIKFGYAYYTSVVGKQTYKYMLVTKEGNDNYYTMNFWTLENIFDKYSDQFMEWAKTIIVE